MIVYRQLTWVALLSVWLLLAGVESFSTRTRLFKAVPLYSTSASEQAASTVDEDDDESSLTSKGLLRCDRYVATNRFAVNKGKEAKFEKRWATRKSRLASLDGFKYFHLMRRVKLPDEGAATYDQGTEDGSTQGNYVSFTIWEKKSHFSAWRKGDAFVEAHGGKSIASFVTTMISSAMVLGGPPRPAFYDGLLLQSTKPDSGSIPKTVDGWRSVEADGVNTLPTECFVACNQFFVPPENAAAFEQRWANRKSKLKECDGFVAFSMLRRDGSAKGHGTSPVTNDEPTYMSTTVWKDQASFEGWRKGMAFREAHGSNDAKDNKEPAKPPAPPLWSKPPQPVFYEGTLVITSEDGA